MVTKPQTNIFLQKHNSLSAAKKNWSFATSILITPLCHFGKICSRQYGV